MPAEYVRLKIEFGGAHDALVHTPRMEAMRILKRITNEIIADRDGGIIRDFNGNKIGDWFLDIEEGDNDD